MTTTKSGDSPSKGGDGGPSSTKIHIDQDGWTRISSPSTQVQIKQQPIPFSSGGTSSLITHPHGVSKETKRRPRVYVAGPYTGENEEDTQLNVEEALAVGDRLFKAGFAPMVPHLTHYWDFQYAHSYEEWMELDMAWVEAAEAVYRMPGESAGADRETDLARKMGIPLYNDINRLIKARETLNIWPTHGKREQVLTQMTAESSYEGDPRFLEVLDQLATTHSAKQQDYGSDTDPYHNVRGSQDWGLQPWVGALVRATDKLNRLQRFAQRGTLANESAEDSLIDLAVYSIISLVLYREASGQSN